jgi:hypothetical protein
MCANSKRSLGYGCLGFVYAKSWVINEPTTIKNESGKTHLDNVNTFLKRSTKDLLMVLVQAETS